jgi:cadmium resistance protein CadD (predicted permease)
MNRAISVLTASVTTFAATNIDDLCLLTLFFARRIPGRHIVAGQYLGFAIIVFVSSLGALLSFAIPAQWIRFLGLLPLALGIKELLQMRKTQDRGETFEPKQSLMSIAMVTVSNGADNVGVYIPFFRFNSPHLWLILAVYGVLVAMWCVAGRWLGRHPLILRVLDRAGHWLVPFVFIGLGLYILAF